MAITIRSSFTVEAPPSDVWKTMIDIERSAPCFPGAELKEQQPDGSYKGGFTVKLGPLTLPHQLARVVLLEQLFRAHKIIAGETYHY